MKTREGGGLKIIHLKIKYKNCETGDYIVENKE
jgi:hypothetical protein